MDVLRFLLYLLVGSAISAIYFVVKYPFSLLEKGKRVVDILYQVLFGVFVIVILPKVFAVLSNGEASAWFFFAIVIGVNVFVNIVKPPLDRIWFSMYNKTITNDRRKDKEK